jgi:hypothetical protein
MDPCLQPGALVRGQLGSSDERGQFGLREMLEMTESGIDHVGCAPSIGPATC